MNDENHDKLALFMRSLSDDMKKSIPLTSFYVKDLSSSLVKVDSSDSHHTNKLPCYWFYKPVSQLYKTFDNE